MDPTPRRKQVFLPLLVGGVPSPRGLQVMGEETRGVGAPRLQSNRGSWMLVMGLIFTGLPGTMASAVPWPDLSTVPPDLQVPEARAAAPAPGVRRVQTTAGWAGTAVHHTLYLPTDWSPGKRFPVLVEYAGNGGYRNAFGDVSEGTVEGCRLGYGISGGRGFLWLCLPFVEVGEGGKRNATKWWGDVLETKRYCLATVRDVCARLGGDERAVVFCGFSRGAIAANYLGLHDDEIAPLWRAFICHSHYDGVSERWPYAGVDRASALVRLRRLGGRPQFISHEGSTRATEDWLRDTGVDGRWTFVAIPFRNHSPDWVLRDLPARRELRTWLADVLAP